LSPVQGTLQAFSDFGVRTIRGWVGPIVSETLAREKTMNKAVVFASIAASLATASVASADLFSGINGFNVYQRWYSDYPGSSVTITNGGLPSLRMQESNFTSSTGFADRHVAFLSSGGVPFQFTGTQSFRFDVDVTINSTLPAGAGNEVGIINGTAPNLGTANPSGGANTGDFHIRLPDGEIAAFGGANPFFSSNQHPLSNGNDPAWPPITPFTPYHMTLIYETSVAGSTWNFGVNNVFTGRLAGSPFFAGGYLGVFEQGPNQSPVSPGSSIDVQFNNATIQIPAPAGAAMLGMGGLLLFRRRRN
jgi:uncharacterized protein (TIGR03382 family)